MIERVTLCFVVSDSHDSSLPGEGDTITAFSLTAEYAVHIRRVLSVAPPTNGIVALTVLAERKRLDDDLSAK